MPAFARTIGIDYSGAETPTAGLKGLRVYLATSDAPPVEVPPPPSPRNCWTRKAIANGWWSGWPRGHADACQSATAFRFRCAISRRTGCCPIGRASSTRFPAALADR